MLDSLEPPGPYIVGLNWSGFDDRVVHDGGEPQGQRWRERNPVVTFYTCLSTVLTGAQCAQAPLVTAVVSFDDYVGGIGNLPYQCNIANVSCGEGATEVSWTSVNSTNS